MLMGHVKIHKGKNNLFLFHLKTFVPKRMVVRYIEGNLRVNYFSLTPYKPQLVWFIWKSVTWSMWCEPSRKKSNV